MGADALGADRCSIAGIENAVTMEMAKPESAEFGVMFDLATIAQDMRGEEAYAREGHTARTLAREPDLRVVLIAMRAGSRVADHIANETVSIQTFAGRVRLHLPPLARQREDRIVELPTGGLLVLEPGIEHSIDAVDDSAVLVTLGWRAKEHTP
jgi:quercetin dioxygenase-like cupin family protein